MVVIARAMALLLSGRDAASTPTADTLPRISPQKASAVLQCGDAVLHDVRISGAYDAGHAAGAIPLPEADAVARPDELQDGRLHIPYRT